MSAPPQTMIITNHAAQRYIERIRPEGDTREAFNVLRDAVTRCVKTGRTWRGSIMWTVEKPDMRLISKHDPAVGMICVTVLGPDEPWGDELEERVLVAPPASQPRVIAVLPKPAKVKAMAALPKDATVSKKTARRQLQAAMDASGVAKRARHAAYMAALSATKDKGDRRRLAEAIHAGLPIPTAEELRAARRAESFAALVEHERRKAAGLIQARKPDVTCPLCRVEQRPVVSTWCSTYDGGPLCAGCADALDALVVTLSRSEAA